MKFNPRLILVSSFFLTQVLSAQTPVGDPASTLTRRDKSPILSEADKNLLGQKVSTVLELYTREQYDQALALMEDADKISPNNPDLLNLRGKILLSLKRWNEASTYFNLALGINPRFFPPRFNLGEIPYLQKKYSDAREIYKKLGDEDPKNELVQFKIFLTFLLEGNIPQAKVMLDQMDEFGNTPAYYFVQAAWNFKKGNDHEAESYVATSIKIFPPAANNLFAEPLIQEGWLKRLPNK